MLLKIKTFYFFLGPSSKVANLSLMIYSRNAASGQRALIRSSRQNPKFQIQPKLLKKPVPHHRPLPFPLQAYQKLNHQSKLGAQAVAQIARGTLFHKSF